MAYTIDVEPAQYLQLDIFPASVFPGGEENPSLGDELRAIVTDNYFYVIHDTISGPQLLIKEALVLFEGSNKTGYTVTTEESKYFVKRALNCGCGSRVRGIHPFPGVPHIAHLNKK
jgi:hypothetical protein